MKVLTAAQMARLDAYTIEHEPIASIDLMERAAATLTEEICRITPSGSHFVVFAGPGNNGGDALAVARLLSRKNHKVEAYLLNTGNHLSPDCEINRNSIVEKCPRIDFHEITSRFDMPMLGPQDIVIDGLFGTGLNKPLSGGFAMLVKFINRSESTIISIDIPSGLMCEDNSQNYRANIIRADYTFTLQAVKPAFLMPDNQVFLGRWKVLSIALKEDECDLSDSYMFMNDKTTVRPLLRRRDPYGNKGTFGHSLLIAGCYGMAGAAILSARAALRGGLGKLTIHAPKALNATLQQAVPEAVIHHDNDNYRTTMAVRTEGYSAIAIGPGIGTEGVTALAFIEQVSHASIPLVIDADGLNIFASHRGWLQQIPAYSILTPHPKEFMRLFGDSLSNYDMLLTARREAMRMKVFIILKGHYTAVVCPDGEIHFNTTGNSGMATAGSGDVLTGLLLSFLSQGYNQKQACILATYLHGLAGDLAAEALCEESLIASDIVDHLPRAFRTLRLTPVTKRADFSTDYSKTETNS